ncbi:NUDIX hydrolase [Lactococcus garvieae]|jgi:ADP-ribose pyrophosphatase YjhB (NUDIX family)|uniref:ADP-ribose pyrophosphatase n=1 Tax=Lactococcus garvieae DCC43 TaxID=1231377 RepID=K2PKV7_9LACT|nr:NUDIX hydrolase [Lactococcus garvieae]EKF50869.1 ADP-ribose pyrophosphatase [Lactococcus garvieae DCC43]QPS71584.1 NUDIX hydrolase [Lactococcus garvieae]
MSEGYVLDLRKILGSRPLVVACASLIIYNEDGILLQKRKDTGNWSYHGGSIEPGETSEEAASRELFEEVGLTVESMDLFTVCSGEEQHFCYPNGDEVHVIDIVYASNDFTGQMILEESEVLDAKWFPFDQLPENIMTSTKTPLLNFAKQMLEQNKHI